MDLAIKNSTLQAYTLEENQNGHFNKSTKEELENIFFT